MTIEPPAVEDSQFPQTIMESVQAQTRNSKQESTAGAHTRNVSQEYSTDEDVFENISTAATSRDSIRRRSSTASCPPTFRSPDPSVEHRSGEDKMNTQLEEAFVPCQPLPGADPSQMWYVDATGIRIAKGMIYITDVGVRPRDQAWWYLSLGRDVFDDEWQHITPVDLEREVDPSNITDPIAIRRMLWSTVPEALWWRHADGPCQPGMDTEHITDYYDQRCIRGPLEYDSDKPFAHYCSISGAAIMCSGRLRETADAELEPSDESSSVSTNPSILAALVHQSCAKDATEEPLACLSPETAG